MAGHSQFANRKHRKGAQDAKRSKIFTKVSKEIVVAVKLGGDDMSSNPRLRSAILSARAVNMPNDKVQKAIAKGTSSDPDSNYQEVRFEGYAPGGAQVIVECLTDNNNRTFSEIRTIFSKLGGNLGVQGSVSYAFDRLAFLNFSADTKDRDIFFEAAVDAGASDVKFEDDIFIAVAPIDDMAIVKEALEKKFGDIISFAIAWVPQALIELSGEESIEKFENFIETLEENDAVQNIYSNVNLFKKEGHHE